jgi:hypothetical protein
MMFNDWTPVVHIVLKVSTEGSSDKMSNMDPIILLLIFEDRGTNPLSTVLYASFS